VNTLQFGKVQYVAYAGPQITLIQTQIFVRLFDLMARSEREISELFIKGNVKGKPGCGGECAVANYFVGLIRGMGYTGPLCVTVAQDSIMITMGVAEIMVPVPDDSSVQKFISDFDSYLYPELTEDDD
jgi:hypothetical protein